MRLTFATRFECLLALDTLQRVHLLSVTNVDPQRTRNTLLDLAAAKLVFVKYRTLLDRSGRYPAELLQTMDEELKALSLPQTRSDNPHSGSGFSSLQVTLRKMIHLHGDQDDVDFFFEYEIQLMDRDSHERSLHGPASHETYKRRQVEAARIRVFGVDRGPGRLSVLERWLFFSVSRLPYRQAIDTNFNIRSRASTASVSSPSRM